MSPIRGGILHLPTAQEGRYSQSLERGLAILTAFTPDRPWMGIAELAETLEMSRPTTHRYASTLVALDYLEQGPRRKYRLGMRAGDPGRAAVSSTALGRIAHEYLAELRDRSTCTASVAILHDKDIVYIQRARSSWQGESEVARRLGRGSRLPASRTAIGRVLLAHLSLQEQCDAIDAWAKSPDSEEALAAREKLIAELKSIREKGIATADQVHIDGQRCVAAPVMSRSSEVVAAVDVAASKSSFSRAQLLERLAPMVVECAERISERLGYTPTK
ncbi:MAG TPA: IclR family transcriptional regulator [Solirubrobacteraceae bacterium]|nr:IclR family transcriptional regulator [Solirubrobacteraceae bacterium]